MRTPVTPNVVTLAVICIGMTAAFLFAQPGHGSNILGALVFWCASFLDGCDGELARLKFLESRLGGWLDLWADNLVHIMVFMGIGIGLWRDSRDAQWLLLGIVAALGVFFSVAWVSWAVLRQKRGQGPLFTSVVDGEGASRDSWTARLTRFADALSRRDFIFGTIFLALFGLLPAFLWAAAIGSHLYWIVLVLLAWQRRPASTVEA
jgi:phosphatidylglycerophosphate synthase